MSDMKDNGFNERYIRQWVQWDILETMGSTIDNGFNERCEEMSSTRYMIMSLKKYIRDNGFNQRQWFQRKIWHTGFIKRYEIMGSTWYIRNNGLNERYAIIDSRRDMILWV